MAYFFDLSWIDDALNMNNISAMYAVIGGFLGLSIIYAGANIGDGLGWWCVIFAGGLGIGTWILMGIVVDKITKAFERITVDRDISCGIRIGSYLLASGIILGRASAGDWTSFSMTVIEFGVGWPVLPLTMLTVIVEYYYNNLSEPQNNGKPGNKIGSIFWGVVYTAIAIASVIEAPL